MSDTSLTPALRAGASTNERVMAVWAGESPRRETNRLQGL
jgi:hypothetical protein